MSTITASTPAPPITAYPRGDTRTLNIQVNQSDGVTPFNLTGCTVYFTVNVSKTPADDGTDSSAILKTSTNSFVAPTTGLATITLTNTLTQPIPGGKYYYDVQLKDGSGNITSLGQSTFTVVDDITTRIT